MSQWENVYAAGQQLNRYPYAEVVSFVKRFGQKRRLSGLSALDVGCGSGVHAYLMAEEGAQVLAFDASPSAIKHAEALHGHGRIDYSVASLCGFQPEGRQFDLVTDRLSSTYVSQDGVANFYQRLLPHMTPDAQLFWQGFDLENTGRSLGRFDPTTKTWTGFSSGVFAPADTISFFSEEDLNTVFEGYLFQAKRLITETDLLTGYRHSYWSLELAPKR